MIQSGQFGRLKRRPFNSWVGNERHQPDAFEAARVLAWQAIERRLNLLLGSFRQSAFVLVFNAYGHSDRSL